MSSSSFVPAQKDGDAIQNHSSFPMRAIAGRALPTRAIQERLRHLTGSVPRSALRAESRENEFAFAKNPLTEGARDRPGHVVPLDVLYIAAAVADEVVMLRAFRIESCGAALDGHFTHQTCLDQVPQIVISRGP